jgi:hypothetical protein
VEFGRITYINVAMHVLCSGNGIRGTFDMSFRIMFINTTLSNMFRRCTRKTSSQYVLTTSIMTRHTRHRSPKMSMDDRLGVHQRREFVTEASALNLKIPKSNVDNAVRKVTTEEHARTRK